MSNYNPGRIRKLLKDAFSEEEFVIFCYDNFREVREQFSAGMTASAKIQLLIEYCDRRNLFSQLLALVNEANPAKYAEYASGQSGPTPSSPVVSTSPTQPTVVNQPPAVTPTSTGVVDNSGERPDVFISYSRRDLEFVTQLHQELTNRHVSAWFDKENIEVGDQWAASIVEGIRDCKVFLLVLSPDSAGSKNVRKEVDLAQRYDKSIVPLVWRTTEIPVAIEYQLAGIQWMDFKEDGSAKNFNDLAEVLRRFLGGTTLTEAASHSDIATESTIPALPKLETVSAGPRQLSGLKKKPTVSPIALGGAVISSVVTTFDLDTTDQDFVNGELKWLFYATDNFLKVRRGEITRNQAIGTPIPPDAQRQSQANNQLLNTIDDFDLQIWEGQIDSGFKRIDTHLRNLNILLDQEAKKGDAGKGDVYLQNQIKGARTEIVKILQELAQLMSQAYGIKVTSPDQLIEYLK